MGSTRITGSALSLRFGGVDYWADLTGARLTNVPVGEPLRGWSGELKHQPQRYFLEGTGVQSLDSGSLWRYAWANSFRVIAFRYAPNGNQEPTSESPHFVGKLRVGAPPMIGGDAGNGEYEFDFKWEVIGKPDLDDGSSPTS